MDIRCGLPAVAALALITWATPAAAAEGRAVVLSGSAVVTPGSDATPRVLATGEAILAGDTVGFEEGALAGIEFDDGTRVHTTRGMLLWIGEERGELRLTLLYGEALIATDTSPVRVQLVDSVINLRAGSSVIATGDGHASVHVDLLAGSAHFSWSRGSFPLSQDMRAWPVGINLGWAHRKLLPREIARRGQLLASQGWPDGYVPQPDSVAAGVLPREPTYWPATLCDDSWLPFPWVECRLDAHGCDCWDARDGRGFDVPAHEEPIPQGVFAVSSSGSSSDSADSSDDTGDKDIPDEGANTPAVAPRAGIGDPPLVIVLGTRKQGETLFWRGTPCAAFASAAQQNSRIEADPSFPDARSSTSSRFQQHSARDHSSHATRPSSNDHASALSSPTTTTKRQRSRQEQRKRRR